MMETMGKVKSDMLSQMNCRLEKYLESFQNKDDDNNRKDEGLFVEIYNSTFQKLLLLFLQSFLCCVFDF